MKTLGALGLIALGGLITLGLQEVWTRRVREPRARQVASVERQAEARRAALTALGDALDDVAPDVAAVKSEVTLTRSGVHFDDATNRWIERWLSVESKLAMLEWSWSRRWIHVLGTEQDVADSIVQLMRIRKKLQEAMIEVDNIDGEDVELTDEQSSALWFAVLELQDLARLKALS